ncbi:MAG: metal ABC transporter substrate-binding protein [Planctomycetota bacterium]
MLKIALALGLLLQDAPVSRVEAPIKVCATTPILGDLARRLGGDGVEVTVLAKGNEDMHFVRLRPSFIEAAHTADLFLENGAGLEVGWLPVVLERARNPRIRLGAERNFDASRHLTSRILPTGPVDRSQGDVHPEGNPHAFLDPLNGLSVAKALAEVLVILRPGDAAGIRERLAGFQEDLAVRMYGKALVGRYGSDLCELDGLGRLVPFLEKRGHLDELGGWVGRLRPFAETRLVAEHALWAHFTKRFGLVVAAYVEPLPGISPSSGYLTRLIGRMKDEGLGVVLGASYFDQRITDRVVEATGAVLVPMAHQCGSRTGTDDYLSLLAHDVDVLAAALEARRKAEAGK